MQIGPDFCCLPEISSFCTVLFICWLVLQHVLADLIGYCQGDIYNVCNVCFNLTIRVFTYDVGVVVGYG